MTPEEAVAGASVWWADLPNGSIVEVNRQVLHRYIDGTWWYGLFQIRPDQDIAAEVANKARVVEVPVTDVEPPTGSVVDAFGGLLYRREADGWEGVWGEPKRHAWDVLRGHVTRILRWGAR